MNYAIHSMRPHLFNKETGASRNVYKMTGQESYRFFISDELFLCGLLVILSKLEKSEKFVNMGGLYCNHFSKALVLVYALNGLEEFQGLGAVYRNLKVKSLVRIHGKVNRKKLKITDIGQRLIDRLNEEKRKKIIASMRNYPDKLFGPREK